MARSLGLTIWRCDRCGRRSDQPSDKAPPGWSSVERQPMGEPESARDSWDVCDGCGNLVQRLLQPTDKPDNHSDTRRMIGSGPALTEVELIRGYGAQIIPASAEPTPQKETEHG